MADNNITQEEFGSLLGVNQSVAPLDTGAPALIEEPVAKKEPPKKKVYANLSELLASDESTENVQIQEISNDGQTITALDTQTGQEIQTSRQALNDYYSEEIGPNEELHLQLNTRETALETSPLTVMERREFSFKDKRGKGLQRQLKKKYGKDNVSANKMGQIVINDAGVWKKFDPQNSLYSYLASKIPYSKTNFTGSPFASFKDTLELSKDLNDLYKTGLHLEAVIAGGAAAVASLHPASRTLMHATRVGGAMLASVIGDSIFNIWGTALDVYEATPEEALGDIATNMMMVGGGEAIAPGAAKTVGRFLKGMRNIGTKMSRGAKDILTTVVGALTKAGKPAAKEVVENSAKFTAKMSRLSRGVSSSDELAFKAETEAVENMTTLLKKAKEALPAKYSSLLEELVEKAGSKNVTVYPKEIIKEISERLEKAGFGRLVQKLPKEIGPQDIAKYGIRKQLGLLPKPKAGKLQFEPLSDAEQLARSTTASPGKALTKEEVDFLNKNLLPQIQNLAKHKVLKGKAAARFLSNTRRDLNAFTKQRFEGSGATDMSKKATTELNNAFSGGITKQFERMGLGDEIAEMSGLYAKFSKSVEMGKGILAREGEEGAVRKLTGDASNQWVAVKGHFDKLVELTGKEGEHLMEEIKLANAVKGFSSLAPKLGLVQAVAIGGATFGAKNQLAGAGLLAASSGRLAGSMLAKERPIINGLIHTLDYMSNLTPEALVKLGQSEALMRATLLTPILLAGQEDEIAQGLINDAAGDEGQAPNPAHSRIR